MIGGRREVQRFSLMLGQSIKMQHSVFTSWSLTGCVQRIGKASYKVKS